jgi:glycosyltransferase involved in cell wall biosynthesis
VTAFDVSFNREVTDGHARFFSTADDVAAAIAADDADPDSARERAKAGQEHVELTYRWDDVTDKYEAMLEEIARAH